MWSDGLSALADCPAFWFEWDLPESMATQCENQIPPPMILTCLDPELCGDETRRLSRSDKLRVMAESVSVTTGAQINHFDLERILNDVNVFDGIVKLCHISSLQTRGLAQIKLTYIINRHAILSWLEHIEWPGAMQQVEDILALLSDDIHKLAIQLHFGESFSSYISIELPLCDYANVRAESEQLLTKLCDITQGDIERFSQMLDWSGVMEVVPEGKRWPIRVERTSYCKAVLSDADSQIEVKGYLGFHSRAASF
ncbi:hypothetical protein N481_06815 [Pseudoalteromonas luteoviolacea S4047-1]|nr:hypothetical protein N481_06815 [Pseudoalteromonas luteoviolacea S4047-1]